MTRSMLGRLSLAALACAAGLVLLLGFTGCQRRADKVTMPPADSIDVHLSSAIALNSAVFRTTAWVGVRTDSMRIPATVWGPSLPAATQYRIRYWWAFNDTSMAHTWRERPKRGYSNGRGEDTISVPLPTLGDSVWVEPRVRLFFKSDSSAERIGKGRWYRNSNVPPADSVGLGTPVALLIRPKTADLAAMWPACAEAVAQNGSSTTPGGATIPACVDGKGKVPFQQFCAFAKWQDGYVSMTDGQKGLALCDSLFMTFPLRRAWLDAKIPPRFWYAMLQGAEIPWTAGPG